MNVLSLFSGIGGLDLGLERAGTTVVGQVEIDPWCQRVLAKHWPEVPRHDDVRTAVEWWRSDPRPDVDLIAGGVPCQPVSVAGKGLAQADARWLWPATIDAIGVLRPRYALLENVSGLLFRGMGDVLGQLAEVGYDAEWDCVSASAVGAPHQRDRVWIVAYPADGDGVDVPGVRGALERQSRRRIPGHGGMADRELADPEGQCGQLRQTPGERPGRPAGSRAVLPDTTGHLRGAPRHEGPPALDWRRPERRDHWAAEPGVGRVAHGIPRRVDRLRGLGNAVVPQVAEHIGRLIMEAAA